MNKIEETRQNGNTTLQKSDKISNGSTMKTKPNSTIVLIFEILVLTGQMIFYFLESFYRLFVSVPEKSVSGEIVLITGTGHGIGKQLALQYSELGATVICVDVNKKGNEDTVKEINEKKNGAAYNYTCDVSDAEEVKSLAEKVKKEVGLVTILVNNAGIMPCRQFSAYSPEDIQKLFGVNVFAHIWLIQNFMPDMIENNHGHIVALSSMAGVIGVENLIPYCATKFAVRGLMESLNEEIRSKTKATDVKFTIIYPYMVNTGLCQKPVIRFPHIMSMVEPKMAAKEIITAQRKNITEHSIPGILFGINNVFRLFPNKVGFAFKDFLGSTLDEHDN